MGLYNEITYGFTRNGVFEEWGKCTNDCFYEIPYALKPYKDHILYLFETLDTDLARQLTIKSSCWCTIDDTVAIGTETYELEFLKEQWNLM